VPNLPGSWPAVLKAPDLASQKVDRRYLKGQDFRSQRYCLRQHGTLSLLYVIFAPAGAKMTYNGLNPTGKQEF
jgi:hypothetical protein